MKTAKRKRMISELTDSTINHMLMADIKFYLNNLLELVYSCFHAKFLFQKVFLNEILLDTCVI